MINMVPEEHEEDDDNHSKTSLISFHNKVHEEDDRDKVFYVEKF